MSRIRDYRRGIEREIKAYQKTLQRMFMLSTKQDDPDPARTLKRIQRLQLEANRQADYIRKIAPGAPI